MKRILLFLATISSFAVQGQETKRIKKAKRVSIGFNFSPDYNFRTLKNNDGSAASDLVIKLRNDGEIGKFGYTTGLNVCINLTNRTGFEAGIQYSEKGYQTKRHDLNYIPPDPALPTKARFIYHYRYIDIPLKVNFAVGKGKIRFMSSASLTINFLIKATQKSIFEYSNGKREKKNQPSAFDYKKVNISPLVSLGFEYKLSDKIYLRTEPTFRYGVLKMIDQPVTEYLWNAGLNIGLYYGLK